jgi:imidazolonepropionase-like amidohydrolase
MRPVLVVLALVALSALPLIKSTENAKPRSLVINHVTIIDVTGNPLQVDMAITVDGGRITRISPASEAELPNGARIYDASGKFIIPGLWDMHVHILQEKRFAQAAALLLAHGVLGIRDMGSPPEELDHLKEWRQQIDEGQLLAPRFVAAGPLVDGVPPMFPHLSIGVRDTSEAREAVSYLRTRGADFVKVYTLLSRAAYFAVADEALRQKLPFAGHVPDAIDALEASAAGQKSIEHLSGVMLACSTQEADLRSRLLDARATADPALLHDALELVQTQGAATYSEAKAQNLFAHFARNGTWQTPTLVGIWNRTVTAPAEKATLSRFDLAPAGEQLLSNYDPCCLNRSGNFIFDENPKAPEIVMAMRRAGVEFLAGTDAPNLWASPGSSLHQELALFVEAGFTPLEALQTATINPAKYLGLLDSLGTVEAG